MAARAKMTEEELAALVGSDIDAVSSFSSDDSARRDKSLEYHDGVMRDLPAPEGHSKVVSRDVADTLGLIKPGLGRVFFGSDNIAVYEPTRQQFEVEKDANGNPVLGPDGKPKKIDISEKRAKQATDYVNHVVVKECDGYRQFNHVMHDGLLHGNGIVKHWWDPTTEYSIEDFTGVSEADYLDLVADPEVEKVLEHSEYPDPSYVGSPVEPTAPAGLDAVAPAALADPDSQDTDHLGSLGGREGQSTSGNAVGYPPDLGDGVPEQPAAPRVAAGGVAPDAGMGVDGGPAAVRPNLHDFKIKRVCSYGRLRLMVLPPEQFGLDRDATVLDEEHAKLCFHKFRDTRSELLKQYPKKKEMIDAASRAAVKMDDTAQDARDKDRSFNASTDDGHKATELVDVWECYRLVDYDGDGIAEWRKIVMIGATGKRSILENVPWGDDLPFSDIVPDPVPHRWRGRSVFDETEDVARIKTALMRNLNDNTYLANNPRQIARLDDIQNPDVLANWKIGDTLFTKGNVDTSVRFEVIPPIHDKVFPLLEYYDQVIEKRTGVSRASAALDMEALQNQTATATNAMQAAMHTKVEEYARNIAEGGMRRIFKCCLRLITKHQDKPRTVRLRGEWVEMDPRSWNAEMDVTINTGLGSGSRDRDLQLLMGIAQKQEMVNQVFGPQIATELGVGPDVVFATYRKMVEAAGLRSPEQFFPEISAEDVKRIASQMGNKPDPKMMELQAKQQIEQAKVQMKTEADQRSAQFKEQLEAEKARREQVMQQAMLDRQAAVEERQAQADIAVKDREASIQAALQRQQQAHDMQLATMDAAHKERLQTQEFQFNRWLETFKATNAAQADMRRAEASEAAAQNVAGEAP